MDLQQKPHRRYNPLTREWVLVSPRRMERPWSGVVEQEVSEQPPEYDPACYLCPGNSRVGSARNPNYTGTFVFDNDYPALSPDAGEEEVDQEGLLIAKGEAGVCRVVCFSARHDLTMASMNRADVRRVVDVWIGEYQQLGSHPWVNYVQIFENRGLLMGTSNPHPHGQIWANATLTNLAALEQQAQLEYTQSKGACLLCEYLWLERETSQRIVCANDAFTALVPFWAVWPFETLILSNRHATGIDELAIGERDLLAEMLQQLTRRYDRLFRVRFPYSMGFHQRPTDGQGHTEWHLHAHYYPPLLRSATIRKFMVGYEMLGTPQRDITPEVAAKTLQKVKLETND